MPCSSEDDEWSCFPPKWFEEVDKVSFLLSARSSTNRRVLHS